MKIAVNTRLLINHKMEGIQWFTFETLKRITKAHPEHTFYFIFDRPFLKDFIFSENIIPIVIGPQARHPFLFYIWFHIQIPRVLKKYKIDAFVSPDGFLPLKSNVPSLAVIHDINFEHQTKGIPFWAAHYYKRYFPKYAKIARKIATVSEFSKADIVDKYDIDSRKIEVVYNGINESFKPITDTEQQLFRNHYTQGKPFYLFVGSLHPRKNLCNLLRAFDLYKETDTTQTQLLVVGSKLFKAGAIFKTFKKMRYRDEVHFIGHLLAEDLHTSIASAKGLAYVSFFEGFGIPIVEAFACHTPVITSKTSSMPEVSKNAAILIDPYSVKEISDALKKLDNQPTREHYIALGEKRAKDFSWDKTARRLWNTIDSLLPKNE